MTNLARAVARAGVLSLAAFAVSGCAIVRGVPQDAAGGVRQLRLAAEQGQAPAQYQLGWAYATGRGVSPDDADAVHWFRLAAEQDHVPAQYQLGLA